MPLDPEPMPTEMDWPTFKRRMLALAYWLARNAGVLALTTAVVWVGHQQQRAIDRIDGTAKEAVKAAQAAEEASKRQVFYGAPK